MFVWLSHHPIGEDSEEIDFCLARGCADAGWQSSSCPVHVRLTRCLPSLRGRPFLESQLFSGFPGNDEAKP
jgi:hypothetical protein